MSEPRISDEWLACQVKSFGPPHPNNFTTDPTVLLILDLVDARKEQEQLRLDLIAAAERENDFVCLARTVIWQFRDFGCCSLDVFDMARRILEKHGISDSVSVERRPVSTKEAREMANRIMERAEQGRADAAEREALNTDAGEQI